MMPDHCRHVSVHRVDFSLTPGNIKKDLLDSEIYKGTNYLILNNKDDWAIVRVGKTPKHGLFWLVTGLDIISLPHDTIYIEDPEIDVLNKNMMAEIAKKYQGKVVIVKGAFEHVSFIKLEETIDLIVLEVAPPLPPKLNTLVKNLLNIKSFLKPICITEKIIDINTLFENDKNTVYIFPCHASGLITNNDVYYLDECPELCSDSQNRITLVGCDLSLRIFKELYSYKPKFINICPAKFAADLIKTQKVLVKCCKVKSFERKGNLFMVPWGVTYDDLEEAFDKLISLFEKK